MTTDSSRLASAGKVDAAAGTLRRSLRAQWRDRFVAFDPALSRLRMSARAMISVLLAIAILVGFSFSVHMLPIGAFGLAVVIAFLGSMGVTDKSVRAQAVTRFYALVAVLVFAFAASLVGPLAIVGDLCFLVVIFFAVYLRKFGQRWFGVGMISFMGYFMGDYLRPAPTDIGWIALAAALTMLITHLVTNYLLPSDPERDFRRALNTIDKRINLVLTKLLEASNGAGPLDRKALGRHMSQLRDIVLMAEGFIPQGEAGSLAARGPASDLAVALFDLQLVVERLVAIADQSLPPAPLLETVLDLKGAHIDLSRLPEVDAADAAAPAPTRLLLRIVNSRARIETVLGNRPSPAFVSTEPGTTPPAAALPGTAGVKSLVPEALQRPIQVTLACAIAMGIGLALSPARWYWAVLTAFIVFNNARSRADTAVRALQRSGGTFAGLIGGTILATLLNGHVYIAGIAIPVLFFLAFYVLQTSYSLMIFFITLALALIYGLLGSFTPQLLVLRLEETVVGSIAGVFCAFFIFPARAGQSVATALDKYLNALRELITAARNRAHGAPEPQHLLARSRLLDRAYAELAMAVRPLGGPWRAVTRFGGVRERLLWLTGCTHWSRVLARSLKPGEDLPQETIGRIDALADELGDRIAAADAARDSFFEAPRSAAKAASPSGRPSLPLGGEDDPVLALEIISALLARATPPRSGSAA